MMLSLYYEYDKYQLQYSSAIFRLLDKNPDIENMIYPLSNLIHQKIENEIKQYIVEPHVSGKTFKDFKVENTHRLDLLLSHEALKKYYENIELCKKVFQEYKESILYFYKILGEDTFENSRYPIKKNQREITDKEKVDFNDLYNNWTKYSLASSQMALIYIAYCSSNTILHLKNIGKTNDNNEEIKLINNIVENTFKDYYYVGLNEDKKTLFSLISEFVKRSQYFDIKYIC